MHSPQTPSGTSMPSISGRTRNSIRRIFRVKSTNEALLKQSAALDAHAHPQIAESSRVFSSQTEQRPTSSRSTRSVRNIFSTAKRITLRPSMLFRQKVATAVPKDGNEACLVASHSQSASQSVSRHAGAFSLDNQDMQVEEPPQQQHAQLDDNVLMAAVSTPDTASGTVASASCSSGSRTRGPPLPTKPLPAVPHSKSTLLDDMAQYYNYSRLPEQQEQTKSPTSFSSKSLGLHSLDFEYNQTAIDRLLPSSPEMPLLQGKDAAAVVANTLPLSLGTGADVSVAIDMNMSWADEVPDSEGSADYTIDLVDISTLENLDNAGETLRPSDNILTTDSAAASSISSPTFKSCPYSSLVACRKPQIEAADIIKCLGSATKICDSALLSTSQAAAAAALLETETTVLVQQDNPEFVISDIDQLLRELEFTDSFIQGADVESTNGDAALPLLGSDSDAFSLREIDELIEQLGNADFAEQITVSSPLPSEKQTARSLIDSEAEETILENAALKVDIALAIGMLGCVDKIAEKAVTSVSCCVKQQLAFDPAALVFELGAVVQPAFKQIEKKQLSPAVSKTSPIAVDVSSTIAELGNVECLVQVVENLPFVPLSLPPNFSVALARALGNVDSIVSAAVPIETTSLTVPNSPSLDIPDIISELGGVYSPDYIVHNVERVRKCSTQTLVGDIDQEIFAKPATVYLLHDFKYKQFPDIAATKQPSAALNVFREASMDVDDIIQETTRSRATSIASVANSDSFGNINRLISALRVPPFIVSRPLLGPLRNVLFSDLC